MSNNDSTFRVGPYFPANETWDDIWAERTIMGGGMIEWTAYGAFVTLYFMTLEALWHTRQKHPRQTAIFVVYITLHFVLCTIAVATSQVLGQWMFIDKRDYPGGPLGVWIAFQSNWADTTAYFCFAITAWLQDILLIWRYFVVWQRRWWSLIVPICLFLLSLVTGSLLLAQVITPDGDIWQTITISIFTTYWASELTTTLWVTTFIVGRILWQRNYFRRYLPDDKNSPYLSIVTMLIESGLLYSSFGIAFLISYSLNSNWQNIFFGPVGVVQSICPTLIILRVAQGRGVTTTHTSVGGIRTSVLADNVSTSIGLSGPSSVTRTSVVRVGSYQTESKYADAHLDSSSDAIEMDLSPQTSRGGLGRRVKAAEAADF